MALAGWNTYGSCRGGLCAADKAAYYLQKNCPGKTTWAYTGTGSGGRSECTGEGKICTYNFECGAW